MHSAVQEMALPVLRELFSSLEIATLNAVLHQLNEDSREKVLSALSSGLKDRLSALAKTPSPVELTKARAKLHLAYRKVSLKQVVGI